MLKSDSLIVTKIRTKWFFQKKALKIVLLLCTRVKTNVILRKEQFLLARRSLFYVQKRQSYCDKIRTKWQFFRKNRWKWLFCSLLTLKRTFFEEWMSLFYAQRYAPNDSFSEKNHRKWFFCSLHALKRTFFEEWSSFFYLGRVYFMLKSDSLIVTKYARNDSLFQKKHWKCFFCPLHASKRTFFEEWSSFFSARMSLFNAPVTV